MSAKGPPSPSGAAAKKAPPPGSKSPGPAPPGSATGGKKAPPSTTSKAPPSTTSKAPMPAPVAPAAPAAPSDFPPPEPPAAEPGPSAAAPAAPAASPRKKQPSAPASTAGGGSGNAVPTDPWDNPKATTMRLLVAADEDLIPDWKERRIAAVCPMNMPIQTFLERAIKTKMKWENLDGVIATSASGSDLSNIKSTGEVLEVTLTPHQLRYLPDSLHWVWLRRKKEYDATPKTAKQLMLERVQRFYHYYDPTKVKDAESTLENFEGQEELLFVKLTAAYGPEPTQEQVRRRMMLTSAPAVSASMAASERSIAASSKTGHSKDFNTIAASLNLASVLSRSSDTLMFITYYKKWYLWARTKKETRRICAFMTGNMDLHLRREYLNKWRTHILTKKIKRQLHVSTQQAFKSESLVGDLAAENMFLKGEVKRLHAQVEVLDQANSKRLETLFSSSEAAISQIQLLTRENQQKEELINKLESKLMSVGNLMLQANEEKDKALVATQNARLQLEEELSMMRAKVQLLESGMHAAQRDLKDLQDRPPPRVETFPEYQRLRHECDVHNQNHQKLRSRIEELEKDKSGLKDTNAKLQAQVKTLQREVQSLQDEIAAMRHFNQHGTSNSPPPPPPPPEEESDVDSSSRPPSPDRRMTVVTYAMPTAMAAPTPQPAPQHHLYQQQFAMPPPTSTATSIPVGADKVNISLETFFEREERLSREKMKLYMDRHMQPRYATTSQDQITNKSSIGTYYRVAQPQPQPQPQLQMHPQPSQLMQMAALESSVAVRPRAEPRHASYVVGELGTRTDMKKSLFNFTPSSI